jgi:hypothetical protein
MSRLRASSPADSTPCMLQSFDGAPAQHVHTQVVRDCVVTGIDRHACNLHRGR